LHVLAQRLSAEILERGAVARKRWAGTALRGVKKPKGVVLFGQLALEVGAARGAKARGQLLVVHVKQRGVLSTLVEVELERLAAAEHFAGLGVVPEDGLALCRNPDTWLLHVSKIALGLGQ
jgi:hypothetical protein